MLFVAKSVALGLFVASWFARRAGTSKAERNKLLRRLHFLTPPMKMKGGLRVASYKQRRLLLSPVEDAPLYELVVVDEAHHVYSHPELRECVKPYADAASHLLLLSDASQSLGALCDYPTDLKEVALTEVVRSSQRIVNGANAFRCGDFDAKGDASRSDDRPRCHHQVPGPPLLPILFDSCGKEERMQQYATQTVVALKRVNRDFSGLRLHNRLALIVPNAAFRESFEQLLQDALNDAFSDVRFHLMNAEEASACVLGTAAEPGVEMLVLDTVEQFDGLERLIVIAIGLDAPIDYSEGTLETRSRLYRALTRAHMMALVVNEKLPGGWLEFLGNVKFDGLDASAYDAEAQESMQTNASAVITAKTLAIREEVLKAAAQRQLSLPTVVHEAIVRQVQRVTTKDATIATKVATALDLCKEKLPAIGAQLQAALATSSYCSETLSQDLQPNVMLAVLEGEEVAAAVQKVVVHAEKKAVAQAEAATRAVQDITKRAQTDQAVTKSGQGGGATSAARAAPTRVAAPEKEKQTQGTWDTSDVSGSLELAADGFDPYARTSPSSVEAAAALLAALEAHAPDDVPTLPALYTPRPVGVPAAHAVGVPEVLITAESQPEANAAVHLANVDTEATAIQAAFGGAANAEVHRNISISELDRLLAGRKIWCFPGHGDAMLQSEPVLAFVGLGGALEAVSIETLVKTVRPHVLTGKLELIVLTGCCTARLATALRELAFVPYVVCWETVLEDTAGRIFGTAFAQAVASGAEPPEAFQKARTAVCTETEPGKLYTGLGARVQKFELDVDPKDAALVN